MAHLSVENLGKRFGRRILFRRLSFALDGGEVVAITGHNGSGKSTLMRILAGVMRAGKGGVSLTVEGAPVSEERRPLHTGMVAPYLSVYEGFSTKENLRFLARARRLPQAEARIDALIDEVGLGGRGDDLVRTYSSGMKQRVRFAAALLARPPMLLLDEPGSNLDAEGREMVTRVIAQQREAGTLVLVATNDPAEAAACDRQVNVVAHR